MSASKKTGLSVLAGVGLTGALGLLVVGWSYRLGWTDPEPASWLFWLGLALVVGPAGWSLARPELSRADRAKLVALLAVALYAVKVLRSPLEFTLVDEFLHWRATSDLLQSGHLFSPNPLLPISSYYPGLHIITAAFGQVGQLSIFQAGTLIIGLGHLLLGLGLYLLYIEVGFSEQVAGLAALFYLANPNFIFFDGMFAYESLALPMAVFALYLAAKLSRGQASRGLRWLSALAVAAVIITHHLTSYALVAFLVVWWLVSRWRQEERKAPGWLVGVALGLAAVWTLAIAGSLTVTYLLPSVNAGFGELLQILSGNTEGRTLFQSSNGQSAPLNERITAFGAVGLIVAGLPFGLWQIWRRYRRNALAMTLGLAALSYPLAQALRLTHFGAEASNRSGEFIFIGLAPVLALSLVTYVLPALTTQPRRIEWRKLAWLGMVLMLFSGGLAQGTASWARLPGPYLPSADNRSIEPEGKAAAQWMRDIPGPNQRLVSDRVNRFLLGSYGEQRPVTNYGDALNIAPIFFSQQFGPVEQAIMRLGQIQYIVVDHRLTTVLPLNGVYVEQGEPDAYQHKMPMSETALSKFDNVPFLSRQFDSGDIQIYGPAVTTSTQLTSASLKEMTPVEAVQVAPAASNIGQADLGWQWLWGLLAGLLILVGPGYLLSSWLVGEFDQFDGTERFVFSTLISLGLLIGLGLLLNLTPWGVTPLGWLVVALTLGTGLLKLALAAKSSGAQADFRVLHLNLINLSAGLLALGLVSLAFVGSGSAAAQPHTPGFSQLWINPTTANTQIELGVSNQENQPMRYELVLESAGKPLKSWSQFEVPAGYEWNVRLDIPVSGEIQAKLYRLDQPATPYRQVSLRSSGQTS